MRAHRGQAPVRFGVGLVWLMAVASCAQGERADVAPPTGRSLTAPPLVRFSELHYDNAGTDVQEAIEISGPAGTDVTGWTVVLYNGQAGGSAVYDTKPLTGLIPASCADRGVVVVNYPSNGLQNGGTTVAGTSDPDGMALIDANGTVVEFLSYEGSISATAGPATGTASTDIGVRELGNAAEVPGKSLQRNGTGAWAGPIASTFGACNDNDGPPAPTVATIVVTPATASLAVGGTQSFAATARDASNQPIAGVSFAWTSAAPTIATVDAAGVATAVAAGSAVIAATAPNGVVGTATLEVLGAPPPPPPAFPETRISELHYDNAGADVNEAIEIEGPTGTDLTGWTVVLYDGNGSIPYNTLTLDGAIPATCSGGRGVVVVSTPQNGIQNGSPDGLALVDAGGQIVEFLSYEGTFTATTGPAAGLLSADIGVAEVTASPVGASLQRDATNLWALGTASLGGCNGSGAPPPPPTNTLSFSGRLPTDPPLPIGFQDQLFATERDGSNMVVPTTITWSSESPSLADIDQSGVMTALSAGTATFRATAADGTTATYALPMRIAVASTTAVYVGNAEFGEPTDADPSDDFIVRHFAYTASYNPNRGTPNWVSYELEATHFGTEDRCDCFTFDPQLPATFARYTTADYTGAAAIAGYPIDRGHMTRSFDRTAASLDNALTYYFSNVVPQAADLNQGPWAIMENDLGDLARLQNKEVYIIAGVAGNKGTLKNEGKVVIPASTWKVAVIMPRDRGLADVVDYRDLDVIAVNMPNNPGVRNVPWQTYQTTVDALEALTGYDLLARLPDPIEAAVEAGLKPPLAAIDGPFTGTEGGPAIVIGAAASLDPNGSVVAYAWDFGDGTAATGAAPTVAHTYVQDGTYTARVTVTDNDGLTATASTTVTIANATPIVAAIPDTTLTAGQAYGAAGMFVDGGVADVWAATVDYGDGTGLSPLTLVGQTFALSHAYAAVGTFTVTVQVSDGAATSTTTATVTVVAPSPPPPPSGETAAALLTDAIALVDGLVASRKLPHALGATLDTELAFARTSLNRGRPAIASAAVRSVAVELDLLARLRILAVADVRPLRLMVDQILQAL